MKEYRIVTIADHVDIVMNDHVYDDESDVRRFLKQYSGKSAGIHFDVFERTVSDWKPLNDEERREKWELED